MRSWKRESEGFGPLLRCPYWRSGTLMWSSGCCKKNLSRLSGRSCMLVPRGVNCDPMRASLTNILQSHWEWQDDRRDAWVLGFFKYQTAFVASLDVKAAFDVAKFFRGVKDTDIHGDPLTLCGGICGREEGREGFCFLRKLRDYGAKGNAAWRLKFCGREKWPHMHGGKPRGSITR